MAAAAAAHRATDRVGQLANAATPEGQRVYIARPDPEAGGGAAGAGAPAVVLIHQIFGLQRRVRATRTAAAEPLSQPSLSRCQSQEAA
jgi:hypothetical protein